ncbi:alpha-1,6-mannosylglycoprotein 6-beta-N-acetylglucosaminyltransferase A-like isoform X2 [Octopus sinensis]|nr:alpha-1,6-mannosylglycoprotein 6-beta-N-acetylglucosaminyltransferase A-like isoform X2 [Octopus sinensis]XP_036368621.1 alpha-1,6-mannosylglycoprotein 6-beta-N-acetylglucosaminyltransferase A-like isoform X2 [Octopus sinensis]
MALKLWRYYLRTPARRSIVFLALLIMVLAMTVFNISYVSFNKPQKDSDLLQNDIIKLSEKYVRALAQESNGVVDGPYAGRFTAYDLKKTIAVLLENMLNRLDKMETLLNYLMPNQSLAYRNNLSFNLISQNSYLNAKDILAGKVESCTLSPSDKISHPFCTGKLEWMRRMWKTHPCYKLYGVDGTECSFLMYLSEVEMWCPSKSWRGNLTENHRRKISTVYANVTTNIEQLMSLLVDPNERQGYAFIRMRIQRMWQKWIEAIKSLLKKQNLNKRPKKRVLIHLGLLTKQTGWKFAEMQFKGGPLGELVQWSDLISSLYLLGHNITITSEMEQLTGILSKLPSVLSPCQARKDLPVDMIYTDLVGLRQFKKHVKGGYGKFSCLLRIVDSFGTEPAYNHRDFARRNKLLTTWGGQDLHSQQFFTMFPHTPDNSFMGFVVEQHLKDPVLPSIKKKNQAVVYGKNELMWKDKTNYLAVVNKYVDIHGTVYVDGKTNKSRYIPLYVKNHGLLKGEELHTLLRESKLFIGLGFPYEGPAPLEAIANGCVFLNPKFNPPHSSKNTPFFKGKPTSRNLTSQHPYAEHYIGRPYVYSVDINDLAAVESVLSEIGSLNKFEPYMPYEFTEEGMLQRLNAYLEGQNFCSFQKTAPKWPPSDAVAIYLGEAGKPCNDVCWQRNRICEPSYFEDINNLESLKKYKANCTTKKSITDIYYPAFNPKTFECILQTDERLFSCAGEKFPLMRLCPCRDYIKGQSALCKNCDR